MLIAWIWGWWKTRPLRKAVQELEQNFSYRWTRSRHSHRGSFPSAVENIRWYASHIYRDDPTGAADLVKECRDVLANINLDADYRIMNVVETLERRSFKITDGKTHE